MCKFLFQVNKLVFLLILHLCKKPLPYIPKCSISITLVNFDNQHFEPITP